MPSVVAAKFASLDGINLVGDLVLPDQEARLGVVQVHGGGVTRHEAGFFDRMGDGLAAAGVAALRFDLRGHGESGGRQEDLTISGVLNDIRSALDHLRQVTGVERVALVGQSFGGGICAYYTAKRPAEVQRLVLLCPRIDYKKRTIDDRPYWVDDHLSSEKTDELASQGFIQYSPTFRHGRAFLNEVFWVQPHTVLGEIQAPTLVVHGTADTLVPIDTTLAAMPKLNDASTLLKIEGAQHGFAVDGDPTYQDPQSQAWQAQVIAAVADWVTQPS
ncbi:alpha/beta hydrolase [Actinoplanes couchii]|uniref:Alpha/beta hydrolase n=1 Tax=Actinoplanes couchii TaxID=403638 RepID=A0ABQ3XN17_9ACTN|nr:alpha/beta fold hydrolase [Actinoplanes couchii]MDR6317909.1 pimeloyl-ACP methyl ester carboxylesterase [Actinoplanes couchii]GID59896.1 alpha/beta hydrolase [Actinoplanes couchii]